MKEEVNFNDNESFESLKIQKELIDNIPIPNLTPQMLEVRDRILESFALAKKAIIQDVIDDTYLLFDSETMADYDADFSGAEPSFINIWNKEKGYGFGYIVFHDFLRRVGVQNTFLSTDFTDDGSKLFQKAINDGLIEKISEPFGLSRTTRWKVVSDPIKNLEKIRDEQSIDKNIINEIKEILSGEKYKTLSRKLLSLLVPSKIYDIAENKNNVESRQLRSEKGEISILIIEKDYPNELTNYEAYGKWRKNEIEYEKNLDDDEIPNYPKAPKEVNRLHSKFSSDIDNGKISLSDRILMTCKLRIYGKNKQVLFVSNFDGESHKGIGQDFYKNTLPVFAKKIGLRFIAGFNNNQNISFFKDTLGRFAIKDLKPKFQNRLFSDFTNNNMFTIQFLYPEDIEKYVGKE